MRKPIWQHSRMPKGDKNTIGGRLRAARADKNLNQTQLEKLSGVKQQVISNIEHDKQDATTFVVKLARALDLNPTWLETGHGDKRPVKWDLLIDISALDPTDQATAKKLFDALLNGQISSDKFAALVALLLPDLNRT